MTIRFRFDHLTYEVPDGIDILVTTDNTDTTHEGEEAYVYSDYDFVKDGFVLPMLGGHDEEGNQLPTWEELGIRRTEPFEVEP